MIRKAIVLGGAGFIGVHMVARLKRENFYVIAVDRKEPDFGWIVEPDQFHREDLRSSETWWAMPGAIEEIYQFACEVGGLGYIMDRNNDAEMLANSMRINLNVLEEVRRLAEVQIKAPRIFFASSACVYPSAEGACREEDAYPLHPDNEYAYEKAFAERLYDAYARNYNLPIHIGRFHNCFGPFGTYQGGREKAPAAICRKVAHAHDGDEIEVWGDGEQTRSFMYVDDAVEGAIRLLRSDFQGPVNIGSSEMVTINEMTRRVIQISGKRLSIRHIDGPVGVRGRSSDNTLIRAKLGWEPSLSLNEGLSRTYPWIEKMVRGDLTAGGDLL